MRPLPTNNEFVEMVDYVMDSVRDPIGLGSETLFDSNSGVGSSVPLLGSGAGLPVGQSEPKVMEVDEGKDEEEDTESDDGHEARADPMPN
jgi:hypothetical protein